MGRKRRGKLWKLSDDDQEALWCFVDGTTYDDALGSAELPLLAGYMPSRSALSAWFSEYATGRKFRLLNEDASRFEEFLKTSKDLKVTAEMAAELGDAWLIKRAMEEDDDKTYIAARNMMITDRQGLGMLRMGEEKLKQGEARLKQGEAKLELERDKVEQRVREWEAKAEKAKKVGASKKLSAEEREQQIKEIFGIG